MKVAQRGERKYCHFSKVTFIVKRIGIVQSRAWLWAEPHCHPALSNGWSPVCPGCGLNLGDRKTLAPVHSRKN